MAQTITTNGTLKISGDLVITLAADESFIVYSKGKQKLLEVIMSSDSQSVTVNCLVFTQYSAGTDIGNTGWLCDAPTSADRDDKLGVDSTIPGSPRDDIRGGIRRRP